jgi:hypothetical protein
MQKSITGDSHAQLVLPMNYPGMHIDPLNPELESDLDASGIIHLDLNVTQHDNRRNHLTCDVELDCKSVNVLVDSGNQGSFISERQASTKSTTKITSNPSLKIRSVTGDPIEFHYLLMTAHGHKSVLCTHHT